MEAEGGDSGDAGPGNATVQGARDTPGVDVHDVDGTRGEDGEVTDGPCDVCGKLVDDDRILVLKEDGTIAVRHPWHV